MEKDIDIARLITLRKLTTALAERFSKLVREHLANLAPLLQPRSLLGDLVQFEKCAVKTQDAAFQELLKLYRPLAQASALNVQADLRPPLDIFGTTPEIAPASYGHKPQGSDKPITIVMPLKWVLIYKDLTPQRLRELIVSHRRSGGNELQSAVLHYLVMYMLAQRRPGFAPIMDALRFAVSSERNSEFAGLPFVYLSAPIKTMRPSDAVILQSTQLSGATSFEEVIESDSMPPLADPLQRELDALGSISQPT